MQEIIDEISSLFAASIETTNTVYPIKTLENSYPAWVFREGDSFGVAIPYTEDGPDVAEDFNECEYQTVIFAIGRENRRVLRLSSTYEATRYQFACICFSLVDPGKDGSERKKILQDPIGWWKQWKEMVGNSAVNKKPYAVIGELLVVLELLERGFHAYWKGPAGASRDVETDAYDFEVKSTQSKYSSSITVSGQFQLDKKKDQTFLVFNRFESSSSGYSIDQLIDKITGEFGQSKKDYEENLMRLGYRKGNSDRSKKYSLLEQRVYLINNGFPSITAKSFKDNQIPLGISQIQYQVDLNAVQPIAEQTEEFNELLFQLKSRFNSLV